MLIEYVAVIIAIVWLLAVFKVFVLQDSIDFQQQQKQQKHSLSLSYNGKHLSHTHTNKNNNINSHSHNHNHNEDIGGRFVDFAAASLPSSSSDPALPLKSLPLPLSSEWSSIHANEHHEQFQQQQQQVHKAKEIKITVGAAQVGSGADARHRAQQQQQHQQPQQQQQQQQQHGIGDTAWDNTAHLKWPPVAEDGSIPAEDGFDIMPIIDLKVPKFWYPSEGADWNKVGSRVNKLETIFLMIASYRDFQCRETISLAFSKADHPERLFVAAVDQTVPGDVGCLDIEIPCSVDDTQPICKYKNQISVFHVDAAKSTGPVTARHIGDRMYRGEYFVTQMDAHCSFVRHWDTLIINQWRSTQNEMAVLTSYLSDVQGSLTPAGDSTRNTRPIMCNSAFEGVMPARYLRHGSQPEDYAVIRDSPQLEPYWAAGFSFSRGHFKLRVPYDAYQPMVFQGEEIAISIRGFTKGYDFYAPRDSVVFHEYADMSSRRKKIHMFWENSGHAGEGVKSLKRATAIIGMAPDIDPSSWDHREEVRYGLGIVRPLEQFYKLFLIDAKERHSVQLCPFVKSGIMHNEFQKYLRKDGLGIDYKFLENFDTMSRLSTQLKKQHPYWEQRIKQYMTERNKELLADAIMNAETIGLAQARPKLLQEARDVLSTLN